jgi:arsenate reductase-like glutaredoxin family protein
LKIAKKANNLVAVRGKKVIRVDLTQGDVEDSTILECLIGPTGNLRAPTILLGKTLLVGFNETIYAEILTPSSQGSQQEEV